MMRAAAVACGGWSAAALFVGLAALPALGQQAPAPSLPAAVPAATFPPASSPIPRAANRPSCSADDAAAGCFDLERVAGAPADTKDNTAVPLVPEQTAEGQPTNPLADSLQNSEAYGLKSLFDTFHPQDGKKTHWYDKITIRGYSQIRFGRA